MIRRTPAGGGFSPHDPIGAPTHAGACASVPLSNPSARPPTARTASATRPPASPDACGGPTCHRDGGLPEPDHRGTARPPCPPTARRVTSAGAWRPRSTPTPGASCQPEVHSTGTAANGVGRQPIPTPLNLACGSISTSVPSQRCDIGAFVVCWDAEPGEPPQLGIRTRSEPEHVMWQSVPGENFVAASVVDLVVTEQRASFQIQENFQRMASVQSVDGVARSGNTLVVTGVLACAPGTDPGAPSTYELRLTANNAGDLEFELRVQDKDSRVNEVHLRYDSSPDEHVYGVGAQFTHVNLKGHELPVLCQEGGIGRGRKSISAIVRLFAPGSEGHPYSTYAAAPHYLTSKRHSLFLENSDYSAFDFRDPESITVRAAAPAMKGHILYGRTPLELVERYSEHCGRMPSLPDWLNKGAVVGLQGGTEKVRAIWSKLREHHVPVAALWLQDWVGGRTTRVGSQLWWNWQLDEARYPGWKQMVKDLAEEGIAVMGYINPMLVEGAPVRQGQRDLFEAAARLGYLVRNARGEIYRLKNTGFDAGLLDLTNPGARRWIKDIIKSELIGNGMKGWMADFGEGLPFDAKLASGESAAAYHNRYPEAWAALNREAIREAGLEGEVVFFTRSGFTRSPGQSTLFWEGDQNVTWDGDDGLKSAIKGLFSGFSGFALNHSDIGGYTCFKKLGLGFVRETELLLRWMEADAFTAVFRSHEGLRPDLNAQIYSDDQTLEAFARFAKVYAALAPYRKKLMQDAAEKGHPLVRHLILTYPDDPNVYDLEYQYTLGTEYLIAPATCAGQQRASLYLPAGRWVHLWSGEEMGSAEKGGWYSVDAPLGEPPVFYPRGSAEGERLTAELRRVGVLEK